LIVPLASASSAGRSPYGLFLIVVPESEPVITAILPSSFGITAASVR
jgi:hypothetical protein